MKTNWKIIALFLTSALFAFASCRPDNMDEGDPATKEMSEEDALDIIEISLSDESGGLSKEAEQAAVIADDYAQKSLLDSPCGQEKDTSFVYEYNGTLAQASYSTGSTFVLNCNDLDIPVSMDYTSQTTGSYTGQVMTSSDSGQSSWNLDNLMVGTDYILNGTYSRSGSQASLVRNQNAFTSQLDMSFENININKGNHKIDSGLITYTLTAELEGGGNYTFEGTIVLLGNSSADVIINGTTYHLAW